MLHTCLQIKKKIHEHRTEAIVMSVPTAVAAAAVATVTVTATAIATTITVATTVAATAAATLGGVLEAAVGPGALALLEIEAHVGAT